MTAILLGRRFWLYAVAPQLAFLLIASLVPTGQLIEALNLVTFALALGICIAFAPGFLLFFTRSGPVDRFEALTMGIQASWTARCLVGIYGFCWRLRGQPIEAINNSTFAWFSFLTILGAVMHLAAPGAIKDHIPSRRWVDIGALVAGSVIVFAAITYIAKLVTEGQL